MFDLTDMKSRTNLLPDITLVPFNGPELLFTNLRNISHCVTTLSDVLMRTTIFWEFIRAL